jgi:hypothetical protein
MWKKIKKIWIERRLIFQGLWNNMFKKAYIEKIALERLEVCYDCELIDKVGTKCLIPGTAPCCGECGCKLSFKSRSLSSECPHPDGPLWKAKLTQEEEDKLYAAINYDPDKS